MSTERASVPPPSGPAPTTDQPKGQPVAAPPGKAIGPPAGEPVAQAMAQAASHAAGHTVAPSPSPSTSSSSSPSSQAQAAVHSMAQAVGQSVPQTAGQPGGPSPSPSPSSPPARSTVAPPRGTTDNLPLPPRRRTGASPRFALPLVAADVFAALLSSVVLLEEGQRDAVLGAQLVVGVTTLNAFAGLYRPHVTLSGLDQLPALGARIVVSWCAAAAVLAALFPAHALGFTALLSGVAVQTAVAVCCRSLIHTRRRALARDRLRSALVVGTGDSARRLTALLVQHPEYGLRPVGIASLATRRPGERGAEAAGGHGGAEDDAGTGATSATAADRSGVAGEAGGAAAPGGEIAPGGPGGPAPADAPDLPVLTTVPEVQRAIIQNGVQEALFIGPSAGSVAVATAGAVTTEGAGAAPGTGAGAGAGPGAAAGLVAEYLPGPAAPVLETVVEHDRSALVALFHHYGCATSFVGVGPWETVADHDTMARHLWGFSWRRLEPPVARRGGRVAKRLLDVTITGPILVAASPVLLFCALAVRLADGPGVLFRQERVGQDGRPFTLLKFRTLRPTDEQESATRWNIAGDHRMSAVGNILRRTSLDELPQLWNVLRGDMSLVGPRPERPFFVANFSRTLPGYAARHRMPVGITGLAQVHGLRGDTSIEERSRFDNHYIDHWSLWQDICILVRTAASLVRPAGS